MKQKLLLFADNAEGRHLAEVLRALPLEVTACVSSEAAVPHGVHICTEQMDEPEICRFLLQEHFGWVIDATHPCTAEVTKEIRTAARSCGTPYLRLLRTKTLRQRIRYVTSPEDAANLLLGTEENVLLSVCSDDIRVFADLPRMHLFAHVLPTFASLQACETAQIARNHIIALQGTFSRKSSLALFQQFNIRWLVANGSKQDASYEAKMTAAEEAGVNVIVVGQPVHENGYHYGEILELLASELGETP